MLNARTALQDNYGTGSMSLSAESRSGQRRSFMNVGGEKKVLSLPAFFLLHLHSHPVLLFFRAFLGSPSLYFLSLFSSVLRRILITTSRRSI